MEDRMIIELIEKYRLKNNVLHHGPDDDGKPIKDEIELIKFRANNVDYVIYERFSGAWTPMYILNTSNLNVCELDHGMKGGPSEIKFDGENINLLGRFLGQSQVWISYDFNGNMIYENGRIKQPNK